MPVHNNVYSLNYSQLARGDMLDMRLSIHANTVFTCSFPASLAIFGAFVRIVVYGGIMNPGSAMFYQNVLTWTMLLVTYFNALKNVCNTWGSNVF